MGLCRRGKIYWLNLQYEGRRIRESLKTGNKKLAEKFYAKMVVEIIEGRYFEATKAKKTTFAEMVDKYMRKYQKSRDPFTIKSLLPVFRHLFLSEITTEVVSDYRDERLKKVKPATVYQELALMRRMFNVARREWKWVKENPAANLSFSVGNSNARDRWLTVEEEQRLLSAASPKVRKIIFFALKTGMRRGEILNLRWKDVDLKARVVTVEKSKNGEKRSIPMTKYLFDMLKAEKVIDISGKVFLFTISTLRNAFAQAIKDSKIEDFHFHDCRHTFATRLVQRGVDIYRVNKLLGHKTISMTMRYSHHNSESLRSGIEMLDSVTKESQLEKIKDLNFSP